MNGGNRRFLYVVAGTGGVFLLSVGGLFGSILPTGHSSANGRPPDAPVEPLSVPGATWALARPTETGTVVAVTGGAVVETLSGDRGDDPLIAESRDAVTGGLRWRIALPSGGPQTHGVVSGRTLLAYREPPPEYFGPEAVLAGFDLGDGRRLWQIDGSDSLIGTPRGGPGDLFTLMSFGDGQERILTYDGRTGHQVSSVGLPRDCSWESAPVDNAGRWILLTTTCGGHQQVLRYDVSAGQVSAPLTLPALPALTTWQFDRLGESAAVLSARRLSLGAPGVVLVDLARWRIRALPRVGADRSGTVVGVCGPRVLVLTQGERLTLIDVDGTVDDDLRTTSWLSAWSCDGEQTSVLQASVQQTQVTTWAPEGGVPLRHLVPLPQGARNPGLVAGDGFVVVHAEGSTEVLYVFRAPTDPGRPRVAVRGRVNGG